MRNLSQRIRKGVASLLAAVMLLGLLPLGAFAAESSSFTDVEGHWGAASIAKAVDAGLFTGIDETTFSPDGGMTRAMFVTVLSRAAEKLGGPAVEAGSGDFTDVTADAWYAGAVAWGVKAGLVSGYGDGRFGPDDLVTREQMCTFLARFLQYMGYDLSAYTPTGTFADDASISAWAKESVYLAQALGLVQGVGDNAFDPQATATRAAVAAIMARLLDKATELAGPETPDSDHPLRRRRRRWRRRQQQDRADRRLPAAGRRGCHRTGGALRRRALPLRLSRRRGVHRPLAGERGGEVHRGALYRLRHGRGQDHFRRDHWYRQL